jgi:hypothetical protein
MANKFRFKDLEILQLEMQLHRLQVPESVHEYLDLKNKNKDKNNDSNSISSSNNHNNNDDNSKLLPKLSHVDGGKK